MKSSKTDQARKGVELFVGRTYNSLCPVVAVLRYLAVRGFDQGPLFCWEDGSPVTRPKFVERLRSTLQAAGVDPSHYSGHSFRIGAKRQKVFTAYREFTAYYVPEEEEKSTKHSTLKLFSYA